MEKTESVKAEMPMVSLRSIVPTVPKDESEKLQLVEDLSQIGCKKLLAQFLELEKWGDGARDLAGVLQWVGEHDPKGPRKVDNGNLGGSLPLSEGGQRPSIANEQVRVK